MPTRIAWILVATLAFPSFAFATATTFFVPGEAAGGESSRIVFVKDAAGRITHYIYRELGATDRIVKKVR
jgi:hypothetical protein